MNLLTKPGADLLRESLYRSARFHLMRHPFNLMRHPSHVATIPSHAATIPSHVATIPRMQPPPPHMVLHKVFVPLLLLFYEKM